MYAAANRLQGLIESYVSNAPEHVVGKFVPIDEQVGTCSRAYIVAYNAHQLLEQLPRFVEELGSTPEEIQMMKFIGGALLHSLRHYAQEMTGEPTSDSGRRSNFIAWLVLSVYAGLAKDAEERASLCRSSGGFSGPGTGVVPETYARRTHALSAYLTEKREQARLHCPCTDEELLSGMLNAFYGPHRENVDPLKAEPNTFYRLVRDNIAPALREMCVMPDALRTLGGGGEGGLASCLASVKERFPFSPYAPGYIALHVAVASLTQQQDLLKQATSYVRRWEPFFSSQSGVTSACDRNNWKLRTRATQAVRNALHVLDGSTQVLPTHFCVDDVEGESEVGRSGVCGSWLVAFSASGGGGRSRRHRVRLLHSPRACVVAPGLAIAATEIISRGQAGERRQTFSDNPGTIVVTPSFRRTSLLIGEEEMPQYCIDAGLPDAYTIPSHALRSVELLLLFETFPGPVMDTTAKGASVVSLAAIASRVGQVRQGCALLVVAEHVEPEVLRVVEGWGSLTRTVVMLSSVGRWGLLQLTLRFDTVPNSVHTCLPLRAVVNGRAGLLIYPLDTTEIAVFRHKANVVASERGSNEVVEERVRHVVIVGVREFSIRGMGCPGMDNHFPSAHFAAFEDETESSNSDSNSSSSDGRPGNDTPLSSVSEEGESLSLPLTPFITTSVLIGGTSVALQRQVLNVYRQVRQHLVHLHVLPYPLSGLLNGDGAVECAVLQRLAHSTQHSSGFADSQEPLSNPPTAQMLFALRTTRAMQEALWTYQLVCEQQQGLRLEAAWERLTKRIFSTSPGVVSTRDVSATKVHFESFHEVYSAYVTAATCLDTLCRTVVLGSHVDTLGDENTSGSVSDLFFFPSIE